MDNRKMKVFDIFSGSGGFTLGLEQAGMETVAFCEYEEYAQKVLKKNWPTIPVYKDVKEITKDNFDHDFDLICGGFPCTDISIGGKREGIKEDNASGLWYEYKRLIGEFRPKYAVIENVFGLLNNGLEILLQQLAEIGYDAVWTTLDSQWFGIPQRRRRVYILAVRDGIPRNSDIFRFDQRNNPTIKDQLLHIEKSRQWDFTKVQGIQYPFAYFTRQRSDEFACKGVASTLTKRDYKDFTDLILDDNGLRKLTVEERLLLQGYPTDFYNDLDLTTTEQYKLNGMSIPVVKWLGERIIDFDNGNYPTIEVNKIEDDFDWE
jgi:site-specific DNA-cytosine methylase